MGVFVKGEVVILPFPYSDLKSEKRRPALVIAVPRSDEVILCQITKQSTRTEYTVVLSKEDFRYGELKVNPCYIRANHFFTAEPSIIDYSVGKIKPEKTQEVIDMAISILKEK